MTKIDKLDGLAAYTGLVLISAPWCKPCAIYKPELERWAAANNVPLVQVDASTSGEIAAHFGVRAVPTTLYLKEGKPARPGVTGPISVAGLAGLVFKD